MILIFTILDRSPQKSKILFSKIINYYLQISVSIIAIIINFSISRLNISIPSSNSISDKSTSSDPTFGKKKVFFIFKSN